MTAVIAVMTLAGSTLDRRSDRCRACHVDRQETRPEKECQTNPGSHCDTRVGRHSTNYKTSSPGPPPPGVYLSAPQPRSSTGGTPPRAPAQGHPSGRLSKTNRRSHHTHVSDGTTTPHPANASCSPLNAGDPMWLSSSHVDGRATGNPPTVSHGNHGTPPAHQPPQQTPTTPPPSTPYAPPQSCTSTAH